MPSGVYERTSWHKSRIKNVFQKGHKNNVGNYWNLGRVRPDIECEKIKESMKGCNNPAWK